MTVNAFTVAVCGALSVAIRSLEPFELIEASTNTNRSPTNAICNIATHILTHVLAKEIGGGGGGGGGGDRCAPLQSTLKQNGYIEMTAMNHNA